MFKRLKIREEVPPIPYDLFSENLSDIISVCHGCKGIDVSSMEQWSTAVSECSDSCNIKLAVRHFAKLPT